MNSDSVLFVEHFYGCKHELISPAVFLIVLCLGVHRFSFDIYNSTSIAVSRSVRHLLPCSHKAACAFLCGESFSTSNGCWLFVLHFIKTFFVFFLNVSRKRRERKTAWHRCAHFFTRLPLLMLVSEFAARRCNWHNTRHTSSKPEIGLIDAGRTFAA